MRPKSCATVTESCNHVQVGVSVQIFTGDLDHCRKSLSVELVIVCSSCIGQEDAAACQRIEKLLPVAATQHE
jgi:hypothetical protein